MNTDFPGIFPPFGFNLLLQNLSMAIHRELTNRLMLIARHDWIQLEGEVTKSAVDANEVFRLHHFLKSFVIAISVKFAGKYAQKFCLPRIYPMVQEYAAAAVDVGPN